MVSSKRKTRQKGTRQMATLHGFKITSMRSWVGREGIGTTGNLYWNDQKLGEFEDYGDGGCIVYRFPTRELEATIAREVPEIGSLDLLVCMLADMSETEKWLRTGWRKANKSGRIFASAKDDNRRLMSCAYDPSIGKDTIEFLLRQDAYRNGFDADTTKVTVWDDKPELNEGDKLESPKAKEEIADYQKRIRKYATA